MAFENSIGVVKAIGGDIPDSWQNGNVNIVSLVIGTGVNTIGRNSFNGCTTISNNLIIPDSVRIIGESAFINCNSISGTLRIPSSVKVIENFAFHSCNGIERIEIDSSTPPEIGANIFLNVNPIDSSIHVPVDASGYSASYSGYTVVYDL